MGPLCALVYSSSYVMLVDYYYDILIHYIRHICGTMLKMVYSRNQMEHELIAPQFQQVDRHIYPRNDVVKEGMLKYHIYPRKDVVKEEKGNGRLSHLSKEGCGKRGNA
jgi:hypothetical protein